MTIWVYVAILSQPKCLFLTVNKAPPTSHTMWLHRAVQGGKLIHSAHMSSLLTFNYSIYLFPFGFWRNIKLLNCQINQRPPDKRLESNVFKPKRKEVLLTTIIFDNIYVFSFAPCPSALWPAALWRSSVVTGWQMTAVCGPVMYPAII